MRPIDTLVISPSEDIATIAAPLHRHFPRSVRYLFRVLGASKDNGKRLMSYLLFEPPFCRAVIDLGYNDTLARRDELRAFLELEES